MPNRNYQPEPDDPAESQLADLRKRADREFAAKGRKEKAAALASGPQFQRVAIVNLERV